MNPESQVLQAARQSQRHSVSKLDSRKFTLNRETAREIRDASLANSMANWLKMETGEEVRSDSPDLFVSDLESGVVFCLLVSKFGQILRFRNPPHNEFHRLENFDQCAKAMRNLGMSSAPPPSKRNSPLGAYLPCLLEFAVLKQKQCEALETETNHVPPEVLTQLEHPNKEEEEEEDNPAFEATINHLLSQLHFERMQRKAHGARTPKIRILENVQGCQLVYVERSTSDILTSSPLMFLTRELAMISCLPKEMHPNLVCVHLGGECLLSAIWAACQGGEVTCLVSANNVDLAWANISANATQIFQQGGCCSMMEGFYGVLDKIVKSLRVAVLVLWSNSEIYSEDEFYSVMGLVFDRAPRGSRVLLAGADPRNDERRRLSKWKWETVSPTDGDQEKEVWLVTAG